MKNNLVFGIIIGVILCFSLNIVANTIIASESVSYSNNKIEETTVKGSLDELFSSVDINERLGTTDISTIGDGTIPGAINELKNDSTIETFSSKGFNFYKIQNIVFVDVLAKEIVIDSNSGVVLNITDSKFLPKNRTSITIFVYNGTSYVDAKIVVEPDTGQIKITGPYGHLIDNIQTEYLTTTIFSYVTN